MLKLNCGLSYSEQSIEEELKKIELAEKYKVDYVSIISIDELRVKQFWTEVSEKFKNSSFKLCSAPLYECVMFNESIMDTIKRHYSYGVKAMTFHVTSKDLIFDAILNGFTVNSRGGLFSLENMHEKNPISVEWNSILDFCFDHDIEVFIGTSLRPGICEDKLNKYVKKDLQEAILYYDDASKRKLKVQLETLGHVKYQHLNQYYDIVSNRNLCSMGPILNDATNGFDEINAIIGYTLARNIGLNITTECMISRKEHIEMPSLEDVEDEIQKWKVAEFTVSQALKNNTAFYNTYIDKFAEKEKEVLNVKKLQNDQCSAHYNIFGPMNIRETCNMCGTDADGNSKCPLRKIKHG